LWLPFLDRPVTLGFVEERQPQRHGETPGDAYPGEPDDRHAQRVARSDEDDEEPAASRRHREKERHGGDVRYVGRAVGRESPGERAWPADEQHEPRGPA